MRAHVQHFCSRGASVCVHLSGIFVVGVRAIAFPRLIPFMTTSGPGFDGR